MPRKSPPVESIAASDARQQLSTLLTRAFKGETRFIVERSGIPVAAIISPADLERLERYEAKQEESFEILEKMRDAFDDVPTEEIEKEVATIIDEVRQRQRKRTHRRTA